MFALALVYFALINHRKKLPQLYYLMFCLKYQGCQFSGFSSKTDFFLLKRQFSGQQAFYPQDCFLASLWAEQVSLNLDFHSFQW